MPWAVAAAAIGVAGQVYVADENKKASEEASKRAETTAANSTNALTEANKQATDLQEPWRIAGAKAIEAIQETPNFEFTAENFEQFKDPSYDFRMQEGVNALDRSAASRGRLLSGAQDRAVTRYGSDLASQEYGNAFNRSLASYQQNLGTQQSLAGIGQTATNLTAQSGLTTAGNIANIGASNAANQNALTMANANANANMATGIATSANQGIGNYLLYQDVNKK